MRRDDHAVTQPQRGPQRFGQPNRDTGTDDDAVDYGLDVVQTPRGQFGKRVEFVNLAVDTGTHEAGLADLGDNFLVLAPSPADQRCQDHHLGSGRQGRNFVQDLLGRLLLDRLATLGTKRLSQSGHQQPQIVIDLGNRRHGAARVLVPWPLIDADRRLQTIDQIHVRPLHLSQHLAGGHRQALDKLPLSFGIDRIEGQTALSRAARAGQHDQLVARDVDVDVAQIMHARTPNADHAPGAVRRLLNVPGGQHR